MTKLELAKEIAMLEVAFNKNFTSAQLDVWYEFFKDEELPDFKKAVLKTLGECRFLPTIADVNKNLPKNVSLL